MNSKGEQGKEMRVGGEGEMWGRRKERIERVQQFSVRRTASRQDRLHEKVDEKGMGK